MKRTIRLLTILLILNVLPSVSFSQQNYILPSESLPGHPRILLLKGEESIIQKTIDLDPAWKKIHLSILSSCDEMLSLPPVERILEGKRLLGKSSECLHRVFYLSYAWRMTNDMKYLKRAEKELLAVSAFSDWNPSHFLDVAEMTMATAIGYDWLYHGLSEESKKIVGKAIHDKGVSLSYSGIQKGIENWNQVCNGGISFGALAIFEDDPQLAAQVINRAIESIRQPMGNYKPDGAYPEGYGYWGYGTSFNVMFISAIEKAFNSDFGLCSLPGFLKTAGYIENMTGPAGKCFNYSDNGSSAGLHPAMFWLANRVKDYSLLWAEKSFLENSNRRERDRLLPAIMIWGAGITMDKITDPDKLIWVGQGKNPVALLRTSWTDPNAIFTGLKAGSPSNGHAHLDIGSFVMDAQGVRWAMDFGAQDYNSLESKGIDLWNLEQNSQRWQVLRYNNLVHNTLTINNQLQRVEGYASITRSSSSPSFLIAITDLTDVYKEQIASARRGVAIIDKAYVAIRDEVETTDSETILRWTMLTPAEVKITAPGTAELTQGGKKLFLKVQEPADVSLKTWTTVPTHDYDAPNPGTVMVGFEVKIPSKQMKCFSVLLIPEASIGKSIPKLKSLKDWPTD